MEKQTKIPQPDSTAVRTALWRALHVQIDARPFIFEDEVGLKLIAPEDGWQDRPDMKYTQRLRASIIARARFVEDLVLEQIKQGITQYVILGSGLDTFAQRYPNVLSRVQLFEIDQPGTLQWKKQRLKELGLSVPANVHFVPVDFETSSWSDELQRAGFNMGLPAVVACTGVSLYLTREAIISTLLKIADMAPGTTLAMTFYLPIELLDEEDRAMQTMAEKGARESGTPFISFFPPKEILTIAAEAGLKNPRTVSTKEMKQRYFEGRKDGLTPASGEVFLIATS